MRRCLGQFGGHAALLIVGLVLLGFAASGCQSVAETWAAVEPFVRQTLATSLAEQVATLGNQAAAGQPFGPEQIKLLTDAIAGVSKGIALEAAREATAGNLPQIFLAGLGGGLTSAGASPAARGLWNKVTGGAA